MRVQLGTDEEAGTFYGMLVIGEQDDRVSLMFGHMVSDLEYLSTRVFPNKRNHFTGHNWLRTRAILAPKNVAVGDSNIKLPENLTGEHRSYDSIDALLKSDEAVNYPA